MNFRLVLCSIGLFLLFGGDGASAQTLHPDATGFILVSESDNLPVICVQFSTALTSPTHVFIESPTGRPRQFFKRSVLEVFRLTLPNPAESQNFTNDIQIDSVRDYLKVCKALAKKESCARVLLADMINQMEFILSKYDSGMRMLNGEWLNEVDYENQFRSDDELRQGSVVLRLKDGKSVRWPRVEIQDDRLVYMSDIGVQSIHRDELVDEVKWVYFPDTRPEEETKEDAPAEENPASKNSSAASTNAATSKKETPTNTVQPTPEPEKYTAGQARFFRMKDGSTHIGRVIIADEETITIFTTAAKTHRIRKDQIVLGLEEQLASE